MYQEKYDIYEKNENDRIRQIELLTQIHQSKIDEAINTKKELLKNRDTTIISNYKEDILSRIEYPFDFRKCINMGYCKDSKKLVIDYLLPDKAITPIEDN